MLEKSEKEKDSEKLLINDYTIEQMETDTQEENKICKEKLKYILKGISAIISSIIHTFSLYSNWILGYTTIYLISFRRHYNKKLDLSYSYCFIPLMHFSFSLTSPIGGFIEEKYGSRIVIILSNLILCIAFSIMYYSRDIYIDYFLMLIIGIGIGVGINITKKNACSFFMNRKALISGIIYLVNNFLCFILIFYYEIDLLNYSGATPIIDETYYKKRIFMNYQKLIIFQIKMLFFACLATLLFYFQNDPKETLKCGFNEKITNENNGIEKIDKNKRIIRKQAKIKKAVYSFRTIKLIIMIFLFFPSINYINSFMRMNPTLYFIYAIAYNITGFISILIFTLIGDYISFRILFSILSILLTLMSFLFISYFDQDELYLFCGVLSTSFIRSGFRIIFDRHIMNIYGKEVFIEIWGIIRASGGISEIFGIIFNFILEENSYAYKVLFFTNGCFGIISLILGMTENEKKFNYAD